MASPALASAPPTLHGLLERVFGFRSFRANQESVCQAAVEGRDVLLVMPTGAGKSLCYQLPALARGGTALVISPLIALMDDQAAKLESLGLRVGRIHSGLPRESSREVCREYLQGRLQFLFIAPERLRVPGFPEMLAKGKLGLIAIDEAHCISQWGHDFRPDYRMLGQHLPTLRPAPVIALTATATGDVQADIVAQLGFQRPAVFVHGFRRHNLAIEVVEVPKPKRGAFAAELLRDPAARPAIVYAQTRRDAEALAAELGRELRAAPYHAGLEPLHRDRVQKAFLSGQIEVVVATVAFGMGIDKADVRTVLHVALPATIEGYYQEIGRAGRDGAPSRTILMHSFADRRTHDFLFELSYPPAPRLDAIFRCLGDEPMHWQDLPPMLERREKIKLDEEACEKALEKLITHGGATIDYQGFVTRGSESWRAPYLAQTKHRSGQMEQVVRYAESASCRMAQLVRHFGDREDARAECGLCDVCAPHSTRAQRTRGLDADERRLAHTVVSALGGGPAKSTGKLHGELCTRNGVSRDAFEDLLNALCSAGFVRLEEASFEKDGRTIPFRKVSLTFEGKQFSEADADTVVMRELAGEAGARTPKNAGGRSRSRAKEASAEPSEPLTGSARELEAKLKSWRKAEASKLGQPAFCVFTDRTLRAIATERPLTEADLLAVGGVGPAKAARFGAEVCRICAGV
jgi:ATP-dependent DNA helicase RecQ